MLDDGPQRASRQERVLLRWSRIAVGLTLILAVSNWVGWATSSANLTRIFPSWPAMAPWTSATQATLGVAILLQSGRPTPARVRAGRALSATAGAIAAVFIAEYVSGSSVGLDQVFFADGVAAAQPTWPGRPSASTAFSAALLAIAISVTRLDRRWARVIWPVCLVASATLPTITALRYVFEAFLMMDATRSSGQAIASVASLLLLNSATLLTRPDRQPIAWLLTRPDRWALVRFVGILAGFPILVGLTRLLSLAAGVRGDGVWVLSITVGALIIGMAAFFASQREQRLLIEKESLSRQTAETERKRAEAEAHYRILADNAVDVVIRLRGTQVVWISPSVEAMFGGQPEQWIGSDALPRVHPDDVGIAQNALKEIAAGKTAVARVRVRTSEGGYHWVEGRGKPYIDASGNTDGATGSARIIDDQIEAERQLERLARFDTLTGLVNRAETLARLESGLTGSRAPGRELGVLFCDIDRFKSINDTFGHGVGDTVLWTVADRICQCVRRGDTVGRTGGDEILVLLLGLHGLAEALQIAEKIQARTAEPIHHNGCTLHATLSIGATLAIPGESVSELTTRADTAMYQAKRADGNTVASL